MTKRSSRTKILLKKLAVIPVLTGFTLLFAERVEAYENSNELLDSEIIQNELPKEQKSNDTYILEDIKEKLNDVNSLKKSFIEKKDTFNINIPNGEKIKVWESRVANYNKLNKIYEELRDQKPHYIKSNIERQKQLKDLFSKLGSLYFNLSKNDKIRVKRPIHPHSPYIRFKKNGKAYYKLKNELTKEDKKLLPPPPTPLSNNKRKHTSVKSDSIPKLKRIVNHKKGTFTYTTNNGNIISKKLSELTKEEKKMIPPPPQIKLKQKALSNKLFQDFKNTKKYSIWIDGKAVNNNVLNNYKNTDFFNYSGSFVHKNARNKRFPQEYQYQLNTKKYIQKKNNQKQTTINKLSRHTSKNIKYYLDNKPISKVELNKINPKNIEKVKVVKKNDGLGAIYIASKNN